MTTRAMAVSRKLEESDRVRVTEWTFSPGGQTGWHKHGLDYVVVYRTSANLLIEDAQGESRMALDAGHTYYRQAGVEHNVINDSDAELIFVEIELK